MIDISATAAAILASGNYTMHSRIESWRDGELLDGDVPISAGTQETDVNLSVPESATITVPRLYEGVSYVPGKDVDHPLACWGQRIHANLGVSLPGGTVEWIAREWLYITDVPALSGDGVTVQLSGLLGLILEAPFVSPVAPNCAGNAQTFGQMIRKFVEPALHVDLSGAPTDRLIPVGTVWQDGRLDSLNELLDAWPAIAYVNDDGNLAVVPPGDATGSLISLTDGAGGTMMHWGADITRDGGANCVVSRGTTTTGLDVQAVSYDRDPDSPTVYGGPFSPLPVPYIFSSSMLTSVAQCQASSDAILLRRRQQSAQLLSTPAVPHLALQARDPITVTSEAEGIDNHRAIIDKLTMPWTPGDGAMQIGARLV